MALKKHKTNHKEIGILNLFNTLDFVNDSVVILGKNILESEGFYGLFNNHQIRFNNFDLKTTFEYQKTSSDKLIIKNNIYGEFMASKCDAKCCDHQRHFFQPSKIRIDLPIILPDQEYQYRIERSLQFPIHVGLAKNKLRDGENEIYKVEVTEKFRNINELSLIEEEFKLKVPDVKEHRIYRVIYADKNTPTKFLEELIKKLKEGNNKKSSLLYEIRIQLRR